MDINVTKNKITITAIDQVHSGEFKVNTCDFNFSDSYEDLVKRAIFTDLKTNNSYEVDIADSTCDIPIEVLKEESICEIGVYAYEESNDELVLRYSPSPARFKITRGSYKNADEGTIFLPADEFVSEADFNASQSAQNTNITNNTNAINTLNNTTIPTLALITETGNKIELEIDSSTYVLTAKLFDKNNNLLSTSTRIDLPLETMVISASYDSTTKEIVLTLKNGETLRFSIVDLVSGLESTSNKSNTIDTSTTKYPSNKAIYDRAPAVVVLTESQYNALESYADNTEYHIIEG